MMRVTVPSPYRRLAVRFGWGRRQRPPWPPWPPWPRTAARPRPGCPACGAAGAAGGPRHRRAPRPQRH